VENNLDEIKKLAQLKDKENQDFSFFLKGNDHHTVDKHVHKLNEKYTVEYDCTSCGNCCKKLKLTLTQDEINLIAKELNISYEKFLKDYVDKEAAGGFILNGPGCPFLEDNKCSIYNYRPEVCRSYPHLYKDNINHRLDNIIDNTFLCPIVYNIVEELKDELSYKYKEPNK